ncbi:MAG: pseudouridine synthase family protein [Pseudomonadales bacterium]
MTPTSHSFELHLEVSEAGKTAVELLADQCELSRARIKMAMRCGAVWLQRGTNKRRIRRATHALSVGDQVALYYDAAILDEAVPAPALIADEKDYSVWMKPRGVHSQGTRYGDHSAMEQLTRQFFMAQSPASDREARLVHRLDRYADGLILIAHNKKAAAGLSALFANREITKRYTALVSGQVPLEHEPITLNWDVDDKPARSIVSVLKSGQGCSLLRVQIETGRKHQVRRHLAQYGYPIVGDRLYGAADINDSGLPGNLSGNDLDLQLSASYLEFRCPMNNQLRKYQLPDEHLSEMRALVETGAC